MQSYLKLLRNIISNGTEKLPERKLEDGRKLSQGTIGLPNQIFSHNMSEGFPLLTTKKISLRNVAVELEGFVKGITDKQWYKQRGCNIWNEWANPQLVKKAYEENYVKPYNEIVEYNRINNIFSFAGEYLAPYEMVRPGLQAEENDLGPIYGHQWRNFNGDQLYGPTGADQLKNIVDTLKSNPNDRRMICSAWNPNQIHMMALPPCHYSWGVTVYNGKLNMMVTIRSQDEFLGKPYNIASYALLLKLLSKSSGFEANNLTIIALDSHLYLNQIDAVKEQLTREPLTLPSVEIIGNEPFDIFNWTYKDFKLNNYKHHEPLQKVEVVV